MEFDNGWEPEKPEEPVDPPKPPYIDPLHDKAIPSNFRIPTVHITTEGGKAIDSKDHYVNATFRFEDPSRFYTDEESLELTGRIKGRGNTTWGMPKKPYRIKLDEKAHVFSRWGNKDWILLANYSDKTLLRNIMAMEISRICGMSWTPMMLSVEVYVNGQYQGVYAFSDHKEIAGHRVNIEVATETDLEGGYYLELEEAMDEPVCFKTVWDTPVMFHEPEYPTEAQQKYVREWFNGFEHALERVQGEHDDAYRSYIDVPSFINYYIIQEITKNPDGNVRKSTYLTKEKGKPLEMYHVWDFDITPRVGLRHHPRKLRLHELREARRLADALREVVQPDVLRPGVQEGRRGPLERALPHPPDAGPRLPGPAAHPDGGRRGAELRPLEDPGREGLAQLLLLPHLRGGVCFLEGIL